MDLVCDVLIVGAGLAGLNTAINLNEDLKIIVLSNDKLHRCNSYLAQGGITTVKNEADKPIFIEDTLRAGAYENDVDTVKLVANHAKEAIQKLIDLGVPFNKNENGHLKYTKEAAHSTNRILYSADSSGKAIWETVRDEALKRKNIKILEETNLIDLIVKNNEVYGGVAIRENTNLSIYSKVTVLASGGIGGIFKNSTNYRNIKGVGISLALKYGIELKDLDYIQLHPTAFHSTCEERKFLITESLRGEGAKLIDDKGNRFVDELMPRDFVSQAIIKYKDEKELPCVLLDARDMGEKYLKERFPKIFTHCLKHGIDISKDPIPVSPCQHYFMGGIKIDSDGKTSMKNLLACGEVSCTGLHGKNRLASNSLLEAAVYSNRVADYINKVIEDKKLSIVPYTEKNAETLNKENEKILISTIKNERKDLIHELLNN